MKVPMTKRAAKYRLGMHFMDATCSQLCQNCQKANYFVGQQWEQTVPTEFHCVTCGVLNQRLDH